jgi:hypothetical protein
MTTKPVNPKFVDVENVKESLATGMTGSFTAIRESVSRNVLPDLIKRYRRSCALADPTRCDRHLVPLQCLDGRLDRIDLPFRHHLVGHDRLPFGLLMFHNTRLAARSQTKTPTAWLSL